MSKKGSTISVQESPINTVPTLTQTEEEKFTLLMRQIEGNSLETLTPEHLTEVIKQRGQVNAYIHEEQMQEYEKFKISQTTNRIFFGVIILFFSGIILLSAFIYREAFTQVLDKIFIFIGGTGFGSLITGTLIRNKK